MRRRLAAWTGLAGIVAGCTAAAAAAADPDSTTTATEPGLAARRARWKRSTAETVTRLPADLLRLPFRLADYPLEHWVIHKEPGAITVYTGRALRRLRADGVYVRVGGVGSGSAYGPQLRYEAMPWTRGPRFAVFGATTYRGYDELAFTVDSLRAGRLSFAARASYDERPQEDFFGLGLASQKRDRATYQQDETVVRGQMRLALSGSWSATAAAGWSRSDIGRGRDADFPSVLQVFDGGVIPGLGGRWEFGDLGVALAYDTRDVPRYARRGRFVQAMVAASEGLGDTPQAYTKWSLEAAQFVPLPGWRRSLAFRARAAITDQRSAADLPVFRLERLGGSRTLRGFETYRFHGEESLLGNVEYRFPIWTIDPPGGQALDGVAFSDFGTVLQDLGDVRPRDLRGSGGIGIRFATARDLVFRLDQAWTPEGRRTHFGLRGTF